MVSQIDEFHPKNIMNGEEDRMDENMDLYSNGCMRPCAIKETAFMSYFGQLKSNYMLKGS